MKILLKNKKMTDSSTDGGSRKGIYSEEDIRGLSAGEEIPFEVG